MLSRPVRVADAAGLVAAFTYNDDYDRATELITKGTATLQAKTFFAEGKYEIATEQGQEKQRLYLDGSPYDASIVVEKEGSSAPQLYWLHRDYLGSITHISNNSGNLAAEYSYDAWGRLRDANSWQPFAPDAMPELMFGRGYTGHEHLTGFGLIHMNARLYDPVLGRFLAPDPQVADPGSTNGFNRYAYASNNPLMFVDLDGEQTVDGNSGYNGNTGNSAYWNQSMASMNYGISGSAYPRTGNPNNPNAGYGGGGANFGGGLNYGGGYSWESGAAGAIVSTLFYLFSSHKGSAQLEATNIVLDPRYSQYHAAKPKPLQKPVGTGAATVYAGGGKGLRMDNTRVATAPYLPTKELTAEQRARRYIESLEAPPVNDYSAWYYQSFFIGDWMRAGGDCAQGNYLSMVNNMCFGLLCVIPECRVAGVAAREVAAVSVEQYTLRAAEDGFYPVMKRGFANSQELTWLNKGDVWKFGTTKNPLTRYSQSYLDNIGEFGVYYKTEFTGTLKEALTVERMKILNFRGQNGFLPAGNKMVK